MGRSLYLVGGTVRDILLARPNLDVDLVLEGNGPALARRLAKDRDGELVTHPRFGTATFRQGAISLDIVSARSETYERPGALPRVSPGTIQDDLSRRDFSINAMAVRVDPLQFGELIDPHGGRTDLDRGIIRVLHDASFTDDPTRIWRALRYEQRLGFRLHPSTEQLASRDVGVMERVSGDRLRRELERTLEEDRPEKTVYRACEIGALRYLSHSLEGDGWLAERYDRARQASPGFRPGTIIYLTLLAWRLGREQLNDFILRLRFGGHTARVLRQIPGLKDVLPALEAEKHLPSQITHLLERFSPETIFSASVATDSRTAWQQLELYLHTLRFIMPSLDGSDLRRMGVAPGRKVGELLKVLKAARLDGTVGSREEEEEMIRQWLVEGRR